MVSEIIRYILTDILLLLFEDYSIIFCLGIMTEDVEIEEQSSSTDLNPMQPSSSDDIQGGHPFI